MKSILSKVWLAITSLVLIILLLTWLFQVGLLNYFYIKERANILLNEGDKLASIFLQSNNYNTVSQDVMEEIENFVPSYDVRVLIINSSDNILFYNISREYYRNRKLSEEFLQKSISSFYDNLEIKSNISEGKTFVLQKNYGRFTERKTIIVGVPINKNDKIIGYVLLTSPISPIQETISILKKQLSIITFVSLIIGTLLALLFAKHFTKPILKITDTSRKIAKGDFTVNVKLDSKDEIGVLGDTINDMAVQLGQIEKLRREFIANISHELKTPISLITAYAELVKDMDFDNEDNNDKYLQIVIDEANRLNSMVEDILYLSKMEADYPKLNLVKFPVIEIIQSVLEKLDFFAYRKNIKINLDIDHENLYVYADKEKIHQVFYNIINNAINHSYENSQVTIKATSIDSKIRVEIIDNGRGIPKKDLPYIWDRFYKVDKSRKRDSSGTGLGMAIVKNILEAHGFKYGIESELDKYTMVWFEIDKSG